MRRRLLAFSGRTTQSVLDEVTNNKKLQAVLATQFGDYGLAPDQSSFVIHAMVVAHYLRGGFFPIGGSAVILDALLPPILEGGGDVFLHRVDVREDFRALGDEGGIDVVDDGAEFPEFRSDAFAWANNLLGRASYVVAPIFIGLLAERFGWGPAVAVTAVCPLGALALIWLLLPETKGKELEETAAA